MIKKRARTIAIAFIAFYATLFLVGCEEAQYQKKPQITFAVSAEYPPFEYIDKGEIKGFDIDLAQLIAEKMGVQVVFENRSFSTIFPMLQSGQVDAAISTLSLSPERRKHFDFSQTYYKSDLATVFKETRPVTSVAQLEANKIGCQLGSTMELWLKEHRPSVQRVAMDHNNQMIEALKAGHIEAVLMDEVQARIFSQKNPGLAYAVIAPVDEGYAIAFKKGSIYREPVDQILKKIRAEGALENLKNKWLGDPA